MNTDKPLHTLRLNYCLKELREDEVGEDPIVFLKQWIDEARKAEILEPNAMILSTVSADLKVHARTLLLKEITDSGLVFYTNYLSAKGMDIEHCENVAITFLWKELQRQVRIEGKAHKISQDRSRKYFHSRPHGSQLGALASPQSEVILDRSILENRLIDLSDQYPEGSEIPLPDYWGGYEVTVDYIEFWQGRSNRLHDRIVYNKSGDTNGGWNIFRLAP